MKKTKKSTSKIGILGLGEVGKAIAEFYKNPRLSKIFKGRARIKDLNTDDGLEGVEILHICIPWREGFEKTVKREIVKIRPKLTIINSTVAPGTTKKIAKGLPKGVSKMIVHSPVRGIHPHLFKGIKTFVKYIGTDNKKAGELAKRHFNVLGIKTKILKPSISTEIGKLLDTTYYAVCIVWHGEMKKICDKFGVKFEEAVTDFNQTYNQGYEKLGKKNVIRPVLYPPKGKIGGHCLLPNTKILKKYYKSRLLDLILKYNSKSKK